MRNRSHGAQLRRLAAPAAAHRTFEPLGGSGCAAEWHRQPPGCAADRSRTRIGGRIPVAQPVIDAFTELEPRQMADGLAGHLDRDELSRVDEELIAEAIDAAVVVALPVVFEVLDRELTPRLEALPLRARLTLARARRRRDHGLD